MPDGNGSSDIVFSARQLAEIFSISEIEVGRLSRAGVLPRIPRDPAGRAYDYPLLECVRRYLGHRNSKALRDRELFIARRSKTEVERAKKLRLENERTSERYVDMRVVMQEIRVQHFRVRQRLLEAPIRLARTLPGDPILNEKILMEEVLDILTALQSPIIDENKIQTEGDSSAAGESQNGDGHLPGGTSA